jgi:methionine synthase II (cobalamin-independent)
LVITPDCGIKHFPEQLALQKLQSMRLAVDAVNKEIYKTHNQ